MPRASGLQREGAPHLNAGGAFARDRPPAPHFRDSNSRPQRDASPHVGRSTFRDRERLPPSAPWGSDRNQPAQPKPETDARPVLEDDAAFLLPIDTPGSNHGTGADARRGPKSGRDKANFKTRGSIASQFRSNDSVRTDRPRVVNAQAPQLDQKAMEKERKRKAKAFKRVNPDVFIPSTVSVGQLARLLNVRMGKSTATPV